MRVNYKYYLISIATAASYFSLSTKPNPNGSNHFTICIFHNITGYPCPACGTVRGLKYFFHLDFYNSIMINPLSTIIGIGMIISFFWIIYDLIKRKTTYKDFIKRKVPAWIVIILILLTIINEYWNIQKGI